MTENNSAVVVAPRRKVTTFSQAVFAVAVLGATNAALAADMVTALGEGASENMSAALTVAFAVFAVGIGIVGAFKGYSFLKSGVTKA